MARVNDSRDVQRQNEARRAEKQNTEKSKREGQEFSKLMQGRQENTAKANQKAQVDQGKHAGQRAAAGKALLARQGIATSSFASQLKQKGSQSLGDKQVQSESRSGEMRDTRRAGDDKGTKTEKQRVGKQEDKLAAISRDDRSQQESGGDFGGGDMGGGDFGADDGQLGSGMGGLAQAEGAQTTAAQKAAGASGPRIPQHVLEQLVKRVLVGVNQEGLSEFQIEFKEDVLSGTRLSITAKDGKISAKFNTDDVNVRRLLKASEGELARAFGRKGLTLERLEVEGP